jgi:hypothetical protein
MFLNQWKGAGIAGLKSDFEIDDAALDGVNVLLARYATGSYEGDAFVLFEKDGKLFEVNADHCSCYGLEGQLEPEETTIEYLRHRLEKGADREYKEELRSVLDAFPANAEITGASPPPNGAASELSAVLEGGYGAMAMDVLLAMARLAAEGKSITIAEDWGFGSATVIDQDGAHTHVGCDSSGSELVNFEAFVSQLHSLLVGKRGLSWVKPSNAKYRT